MCCGFLSLDIEEFMEIQNSLLLQQLELWSSSAIGKKIMRGAKPKTVEEFRQLVPLTDYKDYCPELLEKKRRRIARQTRNVGAQLRQGWRLPLYRGSLLTCRSCAPTFQAW